MTEYTIKIIGENKKLPVMEFSDKSFDLAGELFLAERSFLKKIKSFLKKSDETEFSANVFTLTKDEDYILIENNVTEESTKIEKNEFANLLTAYYIEYKKLR